MISGRCATHRYITTINNYPAKSSDFIDHIITIVRLGDCFIESFDTGRIVPINTNISGTAVICFTLRFTPAAS